MVPSAARKPIGPISTSETPRRSRHWATRSFSSSSSTFVRPLRAGAPPRASWMPSSNAAKSILERQPATFQALDHFGEALDDLLVAGLVRGRGNPGSSARPRQFCDSNPRPPDATVNRGLGGAGTIPVPCAVFESCGARRCGGYSSSGGGAATSVTSASISPRCAARGRGLARGARPPRAGGRCAALVEGNASARATRAAGSARRGGRPVLSKPVCRPGGQRRPPAQVLDPFLEPGDVLVQAVQHRGRNAPASGNRLPTGAQLVGALAHLAASSPAGRLTRALPAACLHPQLARLSPMSPPRQRVRRCGHALASSCACRSRRGRARRARRR